jgi:hypothetical protein
MLSKGLGRRLAQKIVRLGKALVPTSLRSDFIEKRPGERVPLLLRKLRRLFESLFEELGHYTSAYQF